MSVSFHTDVDGPRARVSSAGSFELAHAAAITRSLAGLDASLAPYRHVAVDLSAVSHVDGSGAALLARWLDRLEADGARTVVVSGAPPDAARLIAWAVTWPSRRCRVRRWQTPGGTSASCRRRAPPRR